MPIKAICFDLDGVYFTPESFKKFKRTIVPDSNPDKVTHVFHTSEEMFAFKSGKLTEKEYWDFARKELNLNISDNDIYKSLRDAYETDREVVDLVKTVRNKGYQTCICSNNFVTRIRELDQKFDFLKDFDTRVFSYEVGVLKPDKRIFEKLVAESGVQPGEIVYSDDSPEKLVGADVLGINTFVYDGIETFLGKLREFGVDLAKQ